MRKYFYSFLFLFLAKFSFAQTAEKFELSPQMKETFVYMTRTFFVPVQAYEGEDQLAGVYPFKIANGPVNDADLEAALLNFKNSIQLDSTISSYSYGDSDGNDFDFIKMELDGRYDGAVPVNREGDGLQNNLVMYDASGKSLMHAKNDLLKFYQFKGYPFTTVDQYSGVYNEVLMLKEAPKGDVVVKGTMKFNYPSIVHSMEFTKADIGKTKELNGVKATLLSMENRQAIIRWDRGNTESFNMAFLNKNDLRFNGYSSSTTDPWIYDQVIAKNAMEDSAKIAEIIDRYQATLDYEGPKVAKYTISGELNKMIFYYYSQETKTKEILFELKTKIN